MAWTSFLADPRIIIDGFFQDWDTGTTLYSDPTGDHHGDSLDWQSMRITHDSVFLYFSFKLNVQINLQNQNGIVLYIDADNLVKTGKSAIHPGAELEWRFGERIGFWHKAGDSTRLYHEYIGLVSAPTVTSNQFELAIRRDKISDTIRVSLQSIGDRIPDGDKIITYCLTPAAAPAVFVPSLDKENPQLLRVVTYNCLQDSLFNSGKRPYFQRLLHAISPDIIGFQEIYSHTAGETQNLLESFLPGNWTSTKSDPDIILLSRYPILYQTPIGGNAAFLLDIRPLSDLPLLIIVAHLPSSNQETKRQAEVDQIMAFIRDAQTKSVIPGLKKHSPIIIMGDMNLVGLARQLHTLLTGDIEDNAYYGPDYLPDWDEQILQDLMPLTSGLPMTFTWRNTHSSYPPGRLDYIIYTSSRLKPQKSMVLYTPALPESFLRHYELQTMDSPSASDHSPVIGDFSLLSGTLVTFPTDLPPDSVDCQIYPNPFRQNLNLIIFSTHNLQCPIEISVYSVDGKIIRIASLDPIQTKTTQWVWDGCDKHGHTVSSGIYLISIRTHTGGYSVRKAIRLN